MGEAYSRIGGTIDLKHITLMFVGHCLRLRAIYLGSFVSNRLYVVVPVKLIVN